MNLVSKAFENSKIPPGILQILPKLELTNLRPSSTAPPKEYTCIDHHAIKARLNSLADQTIYENETTENQPRQIQHQITSMTEAITALQKISREIRKTFKDHNTQTNTTHDLSISGPLLAHTHTSKNYMRCCIL